MDKSNRLATTQIISFGQVGVLPVNSRDCGVTAVDTSSAGLFEDERRRRMLSANPVYVPRNWLLHEAIVDAEQDDYQKVQVYNTSLILMLRFGCDE